LNHKTQPFIGTRSELVSAEWKAHLLKRECFVQHPVLILLHNVTQRQKSI